MVLHLNNEKAMHRARNVPTGMYITSIFGGKIWNLYLRFFGGYVEEISLLVHFNGDYKFGERLNGTEDKLAHEFHIIWSFASPSYLSISIKEKTN